MRQPWKMYILKVSTTILDKIHAQLMVLAELKAWKEVACQIDHNHCRLWEMKQVQPVMINKITLSIHIYHPYPKITHKLIQ